MEFSNHGRFGRGGEPTGLGLALECAGGRGLRSNGFWAVALGVQPQRLRTWADGVASDIQQFVARFRATHGVVPSRWVWLAPRLIHLQQRAVFETVASSKRLRIHFVAFEDTDPGGTWLRELCERAFGVNRVRHDLAIGMSALESKQELQAWFENVERSLHQLGLEPRARLFVTASRRSPIARWAQERYAFLADPLPPTARRFLDWQAIPLSPAILYPLAVARIDLGTWIEMAALDEADIQLALRLSAFLHEQGLVGRNRICWVIPRSWGLAGQWTKLALELSVGHSSVCPLRVLVGEPLQLAFYWSPKDPRQDRAFVVVQRADDRTAAGKAMLLRRAGYPVAVLKLFRDTPLAAYLQFVHIVVFTLGYLRSANLACCPHSYELERLLLTYRRAVARLGLDKWRSGRTVGPSLGQVGQQKELCLRLGPSALASGESEETVDAYARFVQAAYQSPSSPHVALLWYGRGLSRDWNRRARRLLEEVADRLFRRQLRCATEICDEGMTRRACLEVDRAHKDSLITLIAVSPPVCSTAPPAATEELLEFHATRELLLRRGRSIAVVLLDEASDQALDCLDEFFSRVHAKIRRGTL